LTAEEIERMCAEAEAMAEEDERLARMREYEGTD
jgi:L1 cell adhesion molecule like protein